MQFDKLKALIKAIEGTDVVEVEIQEAGEHGERIRVRRPEPGRAPAMDAPVAASAAIAPQPPIAAPTPPAAPAASAPEGHVMKSPIVGTFYAAPDPNAPPFVKLGDRVKKGQVVCIVEAMKLMNEIEADIAGEIVKIHHENGQPVQFGEPLFTIRA